MTQKIQVQVFSINTHLRNDNKIKVSEPIYKLLNNQLQLNLSCSRNSIPVQVVPIKERNSVMYCSDRILNELQLPTEPFSITVRYEPKTNMLSLGPIIAIITEIKKEKNAVSFGSIHSFCEEVARYCYKNGIFFYVFSLQHYQKNNIKGFIFQTEQWIESIVPFPQIVHNRIHHRTREKSTQFQDFLADLKDNHVPIFNEQFLNKWDVHELLSRNEQLTPYIPETTLLTSKIVLEDALEQHGCVFIKPIHGSQGKKIFKVTIENGSFHLDYTTFTGDIEKVFDSFQSLFQALKTRLNKQLFIVQRGLNLFTFKGRPLDFRILCHRTNENNWTISSAVARVSSNEQFVSNIARGGDVMKINEVLQETFDPTTSKHIRKLLYELAIEISNVIGMSAEGLYGELGIDLAIDQDGKPWVIEVNTKPSKNLEHDTHPRQIRPSAKAIIQSCLYFIPDSSTMRKADISF